ncbi:MAG: hypothetical protein ABI318_04450 [Chthoniobacteraceae bacterium]
MRDGIRPPRARCGAKARVFTLNLRNRLIFRAADEEGALESADFLGKSLDSRERAEVMRDGRAVAELVPRKATVESARPVTWPPIDFRARFLKMWGSDAFQSPIPVAELFDELRRQREL